jgi:hypothetical protein
VSWISGFTHIVPVSTRNSVCPLGAVRRTSPKATMPDAPGLFSTSTGCCQRRASTSATARLTTSGPTPAL